MTTTYLEACVLLVLGERPAHGYELRDELVELGVEHSDRGRIYRILRGMEAEDLVVSRWEPANAGPARRVYELTDSGHERLDWAALGVRHRRRQLTRYLARHERVRTGTTDAVA